MKILDIMAYISVHNRNDATCVWLRCSVVVEAHFSILYAFASLRFYSSLDEAVSTLHRRGARASVAAVSRDVEH